MKRSPELAHLSRDHHVALERALRLRRANEDDVTAAAAAFLAFFVADGERHFEQEETLLIPAIPADAAALGRRVIDEHAEVRRLATKLGAEPDVTTARQLGELLAHHVRFEERELFPLLESALPPARLAEIGAQLG